LLLVIEYAAIPSNRAEREMPIESTVRTNILRFKLDKVTPKPNNS
jgi:hypothetical protein